jgi:4-hydroxybenzoate polyprenyltransferase
MILLVGAPYFNGSTKVTTARFMLAALWGILLQVHLVKSTSLHSVKNLVAMLGKRLHKSNHVRNAMSPVRKKILQVLFDCVAASIAALVGENLNDARGWIIVGMALAALVVAYQHKDVYKKSVVLGGWTIVVFQCGIGFTLNRLWEDGEILLIASGASLSHVVSTLGIDFDPDLY